MSEDFSTVEPGVVGLVLDGIWLRRERERIAIGRRQVAVRLGLPESRVIRVELNKLPVPAEWFTALADLGFPVPSEVLPAHTAGETIHSTHGPAPVDDPPSVEPAPVAAESDSPAMVSPAVTASSLDAATDALPTLPAPEAAPESAPEPIATVPETASPPAAPIAEPAPVPIVAAVVLEAPAPTEPPPAPRAEPLSTPSPAPGDASPIYTGHWLRRERKKRGMMPIAIAPALHVSAAELAIAEAQDSPLPLHWLPSLRQLGLPVSEAAAALAAQSTPSPQVAPPPAAKPTAKTQRTAKAQRTASTAAKADSKPLTGAWLRQARVERSITQSWLSQQLNVNQTKLWRCESKDQTLPPGWLPILRRLSLLTASPPKAEPSTLASPAAAIKAGTKGAAHAAAGPATDGRWLQAERERLGLSRRTIEVELHTSHKQYRRFEGGRTLLPRSWWKGLRKLGFHLPASLPNSATPATPLVGPPDGAWLAQERKRLALTEYELCHALRINARHLRRIERASAELPKAWLAKLPLLGIAVDVAAAQRRLASKTTRLTKGVPSTPPTSGKKPAIPASPPSRETVQSAPAATAANQGADLVALIVNFRLTLGQHTKQPPFEILSRILSDLREAGADQALAHEDVERAARALIRKR